MYDVGEILSCHSSCVSRVSQKLFSASEILSALFLVLPLSEGLYEFFPLPLRSRPSFAVSLALKRRKKKPFFSQF